MNFARVTEAVRIEEIKRVYVDLAVRDMESTTVASHGTIDGDSLIIKQDKSDYVSEYWNKKIDGEDWVEVTFGRPGVIVAFNIDSPGKGIVRNGADVQLVGILADGNKIDLLARSAISTYSENFFALNQEDLVNQDLHQGRIFTGVRLQVYTRGRIGRLRVYGIPTLPDETTGEPINVLQAKMGARVLAKSSDEGTLAGPVSNLLCEEGEWVLSKKRKRNPNGKVVEIELSRPALINSVEIVPGSLTGKEEKPQTFEVFGVDGQDLKSLARGQIIPGDNPYDVTLDEDISMYSRLRFEFNTGYNIQRIRAIGWFLDASNPDILYKKMRDYRGLGPSLPTIEKIIPELPTIEKIIPDLPVVNETITNPPLGKETRPPPTVIVQSMDPKGKYTKPHNTKLAKKIWAFIRMKTYLEKEENVPYSQSSLAALIANFGMDDNDDYEFIKTVLSDMRYTLDKHHKIFKNIHESDGFLPDKFLPDKFEAEEGKCLNDLIDCLATSFKNFPAKQSKQKAEMLLERMFTSTIWSQKNDALNIPEAFKGVFTKLDIKNLITILNDAEVMESVEVQDFLRFLNNKNRVQSVFFKKITFLIWYKFYFEILYNPK